MNIKKNDYNNINSIGFNSDYRRHIGVWRKYVHIQNDGVYYAMTLGDLEKIKG